MKRLLTFTSAAVVSFLLTSCSAPSVSGKTSCENGLNKAFSTKVELTLDRLSAEGELKRFGDGEWKINFSEPNTLSGVELSFSEGNVTASYKGLSFSVPKSAVPVKSMLVNLIEATDKNADADELSGTENDGLVEISGSLEGGDYKLIVDKEGNLNAFEMPNNSLKMSFSDVREISVATSDETSVCEETTAEITETTAVE